MSKPVVREPVPSRKLLASWPLLVLTLIAAGPAAGAPAEQRTLTFEDRVRAQEAIERVRHAHQIGDTRPFEVAVPRSLLERKVRTFLKESAALERDGHGRVTAELLREETQRIARRTRMPERLAELHAALGNDPVLIQECLVRPIVTERLLRSAVAESEEPSARTASGEQADGEAQRNGAERQDEERRYQEWWSDAEPRLEARDVEVVAGAGVLPGADDALVPALPATCGAANTWQNASLDDDPEPVPASGVWTGTELLVFGQQNTTRAYGVRYNPVLDSWSPMSLTNAPSPRSGHVMLWLGARLFVWGGGVPDTNTGGLYDPLTDTWTPTSTDGAPSPRTSTAVWTGSQVLIWGGSFNFNTPLNDGGRYDPDTDTWMPMSVTNAPAARFGHPAVWTGSLMVVWGGTVLGQVSTNTGGRYDPDSDSWTATTTLNAPTSRAGHTAIWTGQRMVVWGGNNGGTLQFAGAQYDPVADSWGALSTPNQPFLRRGHSAVWTGSVMIVWGGADLTFPNGTPFNSGSRWNPVGNVWTPMSVTNAPPARTSHIAVWTGNRMIVWGGTNFLTYLNSGGRYDPVSDSWTPTRLGHAPAQRHGFTAVWTGNDMVIWGGDQGGPSLASGSRYDPATDTWTPTSSTGAPPAATHHTAVWTGAEMIVWGGHGVSTPPQSTGGRYDPVSDTWIPVSASGAPAARFDHTAIWDGSRMIVWGGSGSAGTLATGAAYDPFTETWTPVTTAGAPTERTNHAAVWTGSRMIVWGGFRGTVDLENGGRYDPSTDTWAPMSLVNGPAARTGPSAVWTGSRMVVWGGYTTNISGSTTGTRTGGRYDPIADTWAPTTLTSAPSARRDQSAAWTGSTMMIWGGVVSWSPNGGVRDGLDDGAFYDPIADSWIGTTAAGAPSPRFGHRAVWTGNAILLWGGERTTSYLTNGGQLCACAGSGTTFYRDADGDGHGNPAVGFQACAPPAGFVAAHDDCNDSEPQVWYPPGEVSGLVAVVTAPSTFSWESLAPVTGSGTHYAVISGGLTPSGMDFDAIACLASGPDTSYADLRPAPAVGSGTWYLVRGSNVCGVGPWGSEAVETVNPTCP